jgi:hypothetical protein
MRDDAQIVSAFRSLRTWRWRRGAFGAQRMTPNRTFQRIASELARAVATQKTRDKAVKVAVPSKR